MPYRRSYRRRTRRMPYRRYKRKRVTLRKTARIVKRLRNAVEVKNHDRRETIANIGTTPVIRLLNGQDVGDDDDQYIGRSYFVKGLQFHGILRNTGAATSQVRISLVYWKKSVTGNTVTYNDIYEDTDSAGLTVANTVKMKNYANRFNCRILRQRVFNFGFTENSTTTDQSFGRAAGPLTQHFSWYVPINRKFIDDSTTGLKDGQLILTAVDQHSGTTMAFTYCSRVTYTDS